jgi:predicted nucleic acid-binding protein
LTGYLLDTGTCIYALKQRQPVLTRMLAQARSSIFVSVVSEGELRAGAAKSAAHSDDVDRVMRPKAIT